MAKKTSTRSTHSKSTSSRPAPTRSMRSEDRSNFNSQETSGKSASGLKGFFANPAVRYVAGGIASAILAKVATKIADRYPEIGRLVSENLDAVESRLNEFKNGLGQDSSTVSRH